MKEEPLGHSEIQNIGSSIYVDGFTVNTTVKDIWNCQHNCQRYMTLSTHLQNKYNDIYETNIMIFTIKHNKFW